MRHCVYKFIAAQEKKKKTKKKNKTKKKPHQTLKQKLSLVSKISWKKKNAEKVHLNTNVL